MAAAPAFLAQVAGEVEALLERALATPVGVTAAEERLWDAMRYGVMAGGKRVRPALVVAAFEACGGAGRQEALQVGAAVEMIHTYTLIQDDLPCMDDDDLRRGKPTTHRQFDEATAILASDALQVEAYRLVMGVAVAADVKAKLMAVLLDAAGAGGVLGGQMIDLVYEWGGHAASEAELRHLQDLKTGAILQASCVLGGVLAGADEAQLAALRRYGAALGLAFQIQDDILDVTADAAALGKTPGKDVAAGKATFVTRMGLPRARALLATLVAEGESAVADFGAAGADLRALIGFVGVRAS